MRARLTLVTISGLLAIVVYLTLTLVAYAHYPTSITPADNWLSDLGNRLLNPGGAVYYRIAAVLTGVLLGVFFAALRGSFARESGRARLFMTVAEVCGLIASLALVVSGLFSEDMGRPHSAASTVLFVLFGTAVWFAGWAFLRGSAPRWLSYLAFGVAAATWAFAVLPHTYWLEWLAVLLLLLFVGAVAVAIKKEPVPGWDQV